MSPIYIPARKVVAANGIVYAYRRLGPAKGIPLVLHMHVSYSALAFDHRIQTIHRCEPLWATGILHS